MDGRRHLYFKSAFIMNHPSGNWKHAQKCGTPSARSYLKPYLQTFSHNDRHRFGWQSRLIAEWGLVASGTFKGWSR